MGNTMISIIMPVYNAEAYVGEAIDSIISQSLSFKENVILYLYDDASTDHSLSVCRDYEKKYPENIRVTHFDVNQGVSAVRNYGVRECVNNKDSIVGFVDSDDKLDSDALSRVAEFFDSHQDVNIAVAEIHFFEAKENPHRLNWRFEERDVVDIKRDYMYPQYYIGGAFIRRKPLKKLHFDESMSFWEDALALNQQIITEGKYGLVSGAKYYYRRRGDESSLVDHAWRDKERYTTFLDKGYISLMKYCRRKKLRVIPYIQFIVAYHMRLYMIKTNTKIVHEMLNDDEMAEFREKIKTILEKIDKNIIIEMPTSLPVIEVMLSIKLGKKVRARRTYTENDCIFSYSGHEFTRMSERNVRLVRIMDEPEEYRGMWLGRFDTPVFQMAEKDYIFAENNGERVDSVRYPYKRKLYILGEKVRNYRYAGFVIDIPKEWKSARFGIHTHDIDIMLNEIIFEELI